MKQVYLANRAIVRMICLLTCMSFLQVTIAQNPTTVDSSDECGVVQDFNNDMGDFSSPSIYSNDNDAPFYWYDTANAWIEDHGLVARSASIISGVYQNPTEGYTIVGFYYEAPLGSEFRIRVVTSTMSPPLEILATTAIGPIWDPFPSTSGVICLRINDAEIHSGMYLRYEVSYRSVLPGRFVFDDFALGPQAIPLPVTFKGIVARKENGTVRVKWDVAEEVNVRGYEVERSTNGIQFSKIGWVDAGKGNVYGFTDLQTQPGTNYYRVRNIDFDGKFKYSGIVKVTNNKVGSLRVYPIPTSSTLNVQHDKAKAGSTITLTTVDGKQIKVVSPVANSFQTVVDVSQYKAGMYFIKFNDGEGNTESFKVIKN